MAEFSVRWTGLSKSGENFGGFASDVRGWCGTVKDKGNGLAFSSDVSEKINESIAKICDKLQSCAGTLDTMSSVLTGAAEKYKSTEAGLCGSGGEVSKFTSDNETSGNTFFDIVLIALKALVAAGIITAAWAENIICALSRLLGNVVKAANDMYAKWSGKSTDDLTEEQTEAGETESTGEIEVGLNDVATAVSEEDVSSDDTSGVAADGAASGGDTAGTEEQVVSADTSTTESTGGVDREEALQWANNKIGTRTDTDNLYGAQCKDLVNAYASELWGVDLGAGNASALIDIELPEGWQKIQNYAEFVPQPGDIAVWYPTAENGYFGHTSIITSADVNNFKSIDQNWIGFNLDDGSPAAEVNHNYSGFWGVIRPPFNN